MSAMHKAAIGPWSPDEAAPTKDEDQHPIHAEPDEYDDFGPPLESEQDIEELPRDLTDESIAFGQPYRGFFDPHADESRFEQLSDEEHDISSSPPVTAIHAPADSPFTQTDAEPFVEDQADSVDELFDGLPPNVPEADKASDDETKQADPAHPHVHFTNTTLADEHEGLQAPFDEASFLVGQPSMMSPPASEPGSDEKQAAESDRLRDEGERVLQGGQKPMLDATNAAFEEQGRDELAPPSFTHLQPMHQPFLSSTQQTVASPMSLNAPVISPAYASQMYGAASQMYAAASQMYGGPMAGYAATPYAMMPPQEMSAAPQGAPAMPQTFQQMPAFGGQDQVNAQTTPYGAQTAPAHIPPNLWRKLAHRVWAYQPLSRWTSAALARALESPEQMNNDQVYLGYSTMDAHLPFAEWQQATGELVSALAQIDPSAASIFSQHFNGVKSRYTPLMWPQLRTYDIRVRLMHLGTTTHDLQEFDTRLFAAIMIEESDSTLHEARNEPTPLSPAIVSPTSPPCACRPMATTRVPPAGRNWRASMAARERRPPVESAKPDNEMAAFLDDLYAGLGQSQLLSTLDKAGVSKPSQLAELTYLGGTALGDFFELVSKSDKSITPFDQVVLIHGLRRKFGV